MRLVTGQDINNLLAHIGIGAIALIAGGIVLTAAFLIWVFWDY